MTSMSAVPGSSPSSISSTSGASPARGAGRIVSLLPSATEIVCALGLRDRLVGITHECDFPESVRGLPVVTRSFIPKDATSAEIDRLVRAQLGARQALYALDEERLAGLAPDLIVTQALCDVCAVAAEEVEAAACRLPERARIVNLEPRSLADVLATLEAVADAAGVPETGRRVRARLEARIAAVAASGEAPGERPRVVLLEWLDPPFACGHWSPEIVRLAGGREMLGEERRASRRVAFEEIAAAAPEVLVVACCGLDIERTLDDLLPLLSRPEWRALPAVRAGRVYVLDGADYFSRPGPRLVESLEMLAHLLHPDRHAWPAGVPAARRVGADGEVTAFPEGAVAA